MMKKQFNIIKSVGFDVYFVARYSDGKLESLDAIFGESLMRYCKYLESEGYHIASKRELGLDMIENEQYSQIIQLSAMADIICKFHFVQYDEKQSSPDIM